MRTRNLDYLTPRERRALGAFVARLRKEHADQIERVVLFGSKARGDFDAESDLDVFVLVKSDDWHFHDRLVTFSSPISVKYDALISPKVVGPSLYRKMRKQRSFFLENIRKQGVVLWTKRSAKTSRIAATN
jgi:predicted nucleotidyltransferase